MNQNHQSFITEYLRHRSSFTAYCLAYNLKDCSNYDSIMSAANRLMNNEEVGGIIRSILDNIRHEVEQEVRAEMKQELLTIQRKRELLASIATGEMVAVQLYKGKDCNVCTQMVRPTINQMLRAIDLDNKMVGLYPFYNRQSTGQQLTVEQSIKSEHASRPESIRERETTTKNENTCPPLTELGHSSQTDSVSPLQGDRGTFAQNTPEKTAHIGNNSQQTEIENTQNHNNSQQTQKTNSENHNKTQQSTLTNRTSSHPALRKLIAKQQSKNTTPTPSPMLSES